MSRFRTSGKIVRTLLYVFLAASAALTLAGTDALWEAAEEARLAVWVAILPVLSFTVFVVIYAVDRALLVRHHGYPPLRAVMQVGAALIFLALLWPAQARLFTKTRARLRQRPSIERLLAHREPMVRAAACELVAWRRDETHRRALEERARHDRDPLVREACTRSLRRLSERHQTGGEGTEVRTADP